MPHTRSYVLKVSGKQRKASEKSRLTYKKGSENGRAMGECNDGQGNTKVKDPTNMGVGVWKTARMLTKCVKWVEYQ